MPPRPRSHERFGRQRAMMIMVASVGQETPWKEGREGGPHTKRLAGRNPTGQTRNVKNSNLFNLYLKPRDIFRKMTRVINQGQEYFFERSVKFFMSGWTFSFFFFLLPQQQARSKRKETGKLFFSYFLLFQVATEKTGFLGKGLSAFL